jgi:hypothetical protein
MKRGIPGTFLLTPLFQPLWHFCVGQFLSTGRYNISQLAPGHVASLEAGREGGNQGTLA